ncbi:hypothetical protein GCM10010357_60910 [Streptomyces luteireticuli]|uniref:Holliday junction resolvase n=1 Tax=Streptomyces luteireticuli TaxID=173858 RepID=A0ABP3IWV2_9ACTN
MFGGGAMANPSKARGTAWESAVRDHLNEALGLVDEHGKFKDIFSALNIRRPAQEGAADVGDVHAVPFILECKDVKSSAVPTWLRQAHVEAFNAGYPFGVVVHKTRRAAVGRGRVYFGVRTWTRVRTALGYSSRDMRELYGFSVAVRGIDSGRWYLSTSVRDFADLLADIRAVL